MAVSSVSESPKFERLIGLNMDVSESCCGKLVLGVLVISGGCLGTTYLLKVYTGLVPVIHWWGLSVDVNVNNTGVCDAGELFSSVLSNCSSPEVAVSVQSSNSSSGSESEFYGALNLPHLDSS